MANYAQIRVIFNDVEQNYIENSIVSVTGYPLEGYTYIETTSTLAYSRYFAVGATYVQTAQNYANAFIRDYKAPSHLVHPLTCTVTIESPGIVLIEATTYDYLTFEHSAPLLDPEGTDTLVYFTTVDAVLPAPVVEITEVTISTSASNNNLYARRNITLTNAAYPVTITSPITKVCANASEVWFDALRTATTTITVTDASGSDTIVVGNIDVVSIANIGIVYVEVSANATINLSIDNDGVYNSIVDYSLDGVIWQSGNVFYGLLVGLYTAYIRDQWGASYTMPFEIVSIPDSEKPEPFFDISGNQSFQCKPVNTYDGDQTFANYFNALSKDVNHYNTQYHSICSNFNQSDNVKLQLRNTYESVNVDIVNEAGVIESTTSAGSLVQYVGLKDRRDCEAKNGGNNTTLIYFNSGNIYDAETEAIISQYVLNGRLESWMYDIESIQFVKFYTTNNDYIGTYEVMARAYDVAQGVSVLQISSPYADITETSFKIVEFRYNAEAFDIWEAIIPVATLNGSYYLNITATDADPRYNDLNWQSEPFEVLQKHENKVLIKWYDSKVIDNIDFSTGIINIARLSGRFFTYSFDGEKDVMEDDFGRIIPLKSVKKDQITLETHVLPDYMIDKLSTAISQHDSVIINSLPIQTIEFGESEYLEKTNLQKLVVKCQYNETTTYFDAVSTIDSGSGFNVLGTSEGKVLGI